ncbi:MAG: hypothetical protein WA667_13720 [Candidatus Nitrosopolaris sp.]
MLPICVITTASNSGHVRQSGGNDGGGAVAAGHEAQLGKVLTGELLGHTKQFGFTKPPKVVLKCLPTFMTDKPQLICTDLTWEEVED